MNRIDLFSESIKFVVFDRICTGPFIEVATRVFFSPHYLMFIRDTNEPATEMLIFPICLYTATKPKFIFDVCTHFLNVHKPGRSIMNGDNANCKCLARRP